VKKKSQAKKIPNNLEARIGIEAVRGDPKEVSSR
jgi:hypothetical protein